MTVHTYRPEPGEFGYTFGGRDAVRGVRPGDTLHVWTQDCFGGNVRSVDDLPSQVCEFPYLNPVSGPFHVEGAEPGDTLALHFAAISPAVSEGWSSTFPHFGALTATHSTAMLHPALEERVWRYEIDLSAGTVRYQPRRSDFSVALPLDAMHGTVGVAPAAFEARSTLAADVHGGNLDTPEIRAGVTLYLGVNVIGALFALGDGHARQGCGELCGVGIECAMNSTISIDVVKGVYTATPRLESDEFLMSIGAARPLEDAYRIAHHDLVTWASELTGLDQLDAYQLISQTGESPIGNVVDPNYTIVAKTAKQFLRSPEPYGGLHRRLRALASTTTPV